MKSKLGPAGATTATAHKIAVIFYTMVKKQVEYDASIWAERDAERDEVPRKPFRPTSGFLDGRGYIDGKLRPTVRSAVWALYVEMTSFPTWAVARQSTEKSSDR
jgi:hypothetical protein